MTIDERRWQAHPAPDPTRRPDRAVNDVKACAIAVGTLLLLALLGGLRDVLL